MITNWRAQAACAGAAAPEDFDPPVRSDLTADEREKVDATINRYCSRCPVKRECLQMAIDNSDTGIYGGILVTQDELNMLRAKQGWAARRPVSA